MPAIVLFALALVAATPAAALELGGTRWASGQHRVAFHVGRVTVTGGCNVLSARYLSHRGIMNFSGVSATRRACPADLMAADTFAAAALKATRRVARSRDRLHLFDARGRTVWTLRRAA